MTNSSAISTLAVTVISSLAGLIPIAVGLTAVKLTGRSRTALSVYAPALSLGIVLSTFYDLLQETAGLQLGALNPIPQAVTVILFLIGLLVLRLVPGKISRNEALPLVYGWAIGIGLHGFGEGIVIGYGFISGQPALSNVTQILSYGLHKIGEGFTLGTLLALSNQESKGWSVSGLVAGLPVGLGGALGFLSILAELTTYAFAIGAGFTAYFIIHFSRLLPTGKRFVYGAVAAGFLFMYLAGMLHQF